VEFLNVVGSRRSIRWFKAWEPVPKEKIQRILEAARFSTSPGNLQPWRAVVVERDKLDDATRDELLKADNWQGAHTQAPIWIYWFADPAALAVPSFLKQTSALMKAQAVPLEYGWDEARIEGALEKAEVMPEGTAPIHEWSGMPVEIATAVAAQETNGACVIAALAAVNEGLGTCLHIASKPTMVPRIKELLGVPEHFHPVWVQLVGYPAENAWGGGQRPRNPFEEMFAIGKWGTPFPRDQKVVEALRADRLFQPEAPLPGRREEHRNLARMYGYPEA